MKTVLVRHALQITAIRFLGMFIEGMISCWRAEIILAALLCFFVVLQSVITS
jgi:hypothetical protein